MTLLGREVPDLPIETIFSDSEIRVMRLFAKVHHLSAPSHLGDAVLFVARLGGYMHRGHDGPPGAEVLWRGTIRLSLLVDGVALAEAANLS